MKTIIKRPKIELHHGDSLNLMADMRDNCLDVILIDPPYGYLKNQKLERKFDHTKFFKECYRLLKKDGFVICFGRGSSFYEWNSIMKNIGMKFKEEIIWNKKYSSSPVLPIMRVHETISIHAKGKAKIQKVKIPYLEQKKNNLDSICQDLKRLVPALKHPKKMKELQEYFETGIRTDYHHKKNYSNYKATLGTSRCGKQIFSCAQSIRNGMSEKSIIEKTRDHYKTIHPTQKPVRLLERLLGLVIPFSEKKTIKVADFFAGSMSTAEACYNLDHDCLAVEIDAEYYKDGENRIQQLKHKPKTLFDEKK